MSALPPMFTPLSSWFLDFSLTHSPGHFHAFFSVYLWDFYFILALLYRRFSLKVAYAFRWFCLVKFHLWLTCFQSCTVCHSKLLFFWVPGVQAVHNPYQPPRVFRPAPKPNLTQGLGYLHMAALRLTFSNSPGKKKKKHIPFFFSICMRLWREPWQPLPRFVGQFRQLSITSKHQMGWMEAILQKVLCEWLLQWSFQLEWEQPESIACSAQFHRLKSCRWLPQAPEVSLPPWCISNKL